LAIVADRTRFIRAYFPPESGHVQCTTSCLLWANSGQERAVQTERPPRNVRFVKRTSCKPPLEKNPGFVCRGIWHFKCRGVDSLNTHQKS
jgi:hypothetical protein